MHCIKQNTFSVTPKLYLDIILKKSEQMDVALLCSMLQLGHCIMDSIKFKFNDKYHCIRKTILSGEGLSNLNIK